jgi:lipid II:glycine glycyltransferase (peptidoglycan interpeptide bridge formation enzyme)
MEGNYVYIHVLSEGKVISTELVLYGSENCYSFLGGTNQEYFHFRPNDFLKFEIIKWAKAQGLKRFILGGGYGDDDGIFQYKRSLAPNGVCDFYIGKKVFDEKKYSKLVSIRESEAEYRANIKYFPVYRG